MKNNLTTELKTNQGVDQHTLVDTHPSLSEEERNNLLCQPMRLSKQEIAKKYASYGKELSDPFLFMITSGENGKHCDLYPGGSILEGRKCKENHFWLTDRIDSIPDYFAKMVLLEKPKVKTCPACKNEFLIDWVFINDTEKNITCCIRCFERGKLHFSDRDAYRKAIRNELRMELGLKLEK